MQLHLKRFLHHTNIKKKLSSVYKKMVKQGLNLSLNELRLIAEHGNISDYENKSAKKIW